jgi:hypothetical protein
MTMKPGRSSPQPFKADDPFAPATEPRLAVLPARAPVLSLTGVPWLILSFAEIRELPLDHRSGFVLSLIDVSVDVGAIVDMSEMPRDEVIAILGELLLRGVIEMR